VSDEIYAAVASVARYVFAAMMALIVFRAWRITLIDARRARELRRLSPETGVTGEMLVIRGDGKVYKGDRFTVIREGLIGSAGRADIRLRARSVRRAHVFFEVTGKGMRLRTAGGRYGTYIKDRHGNKCHTLMLGDGGRVWIGNILLMVMLTSAPSDSVYDMFGAEGDERETDVPALNDNDIFMDAPSDNDIDDREDEVPRPARQKKRHDWFDV